MIRSWNPRWWLLSLIVAMAWPGASAGAMDLVDDRGVRVVLHRPAQRIVSLLPSLTEMVCDLGQCQRLVGVDRYSNYPAQVRGLPKVGGGLDPNMELIVGLRPDLVLLATSSPAAGRLESLGLKVVAFEPKQYADVQRVLQHIGILLAVPDAPALWRKIEDAVAATARSLPPGVAGRRVYFEVNSAPYAAGTASFIGETLHRLGVENIVPASLGPFPKINPEFVVRADPDLIMVGDATYTGMAQRPGWSRMRAIREGKVCVYTPAQSDLMVRAGPRMAEAAQTMADCLRRHLP